MTARALWRRASNYKGDFVDDQHFERVDATTVIVHSNMGDRTVQDRYDEAGRRVESRTTRGNGQFEDRWLYVYDRSGRVVESTGSMLRGNLRFYEIYP